MTISLSDSPYKGLAEKRSLKLALDYNAKHPTRYLFPIAKGSKYPPLLKDNLEAASNDPEQITAWVKKHPGCNWGLAHAKSRVLVVDVDTKADKNGEVTFDLLDVEYGFPVTEENATPSGGRHLVYEGEHIFALGENGFGQDVDSPNYSLIPGCKLRDGTTYEAINDRPAAPAPAWFYAVLGRAKERLTDAGEAAVDLDKPENIAWAVDFLKADAERAIEGRSGDLQTVKIAMGLRDRGISEVRAFELMLEHYNERCEPPWDADDLRRKVENGYSYASQSQVGGKTAEADFADEPTDLSSILTEGDPEEIERARQQREADRAQDSKHPVDQREKPRLTKEQVFDRFVYINKGMRFVDRKMIDDSGERTIYDVPEFSGAFLHLWKNPANAVRSKPRGTVRRYEGLAYRPGKPEFIDRTFYNLWKPSDIVPAPATSVKAKAGLAFIHSHINDYLLPDAESQNHLWNWLGWLYQNMDQKPRHALILQGEKQGTGKSFIVNMMTTILGKHNTRELKTSDIGGDFNGWAMNKKLLFIEEIRSMDKAEISRNLHTLITQERIAINEKKEKAFNIDNCFGFFLMTNDAAALKLDNSDRRYLVLRTDAVPRDKPESGELFDPSYYQRLYSLIRESEVMAAVAYELQNRALGDYSGAGKAPETQAKLEMQAASANDVASWMRENAGMAPLSWPLVTIDDVYQAMPSHLQRQPRAQRNIADELKTGFKGISLGQIRLGGRDADKPRLWGINGTLTEQEWEAIPDRKKAKMYLKQTLTVVSKQFEDDTAAVPQSDSLDDLLGPAPTQH